MRLHGSLLQRPAETEWQNLFLQQLPDWHQHAACWNVADRRIFFPPQGKTAAEAKTYCARCPVTEPCLQTALEMSYNDDIGVWGGLSMSERRRLRRARTKGDTPPVPRPLPTSQRFEARFPDVAGTILAMRQAGHTYAKISAAVACPARTVRRVVERSAA